MGGLSYTTQKTFPVIGTKALTTRTSWSLTASYQTETGTHPTKHFECGGFSKVNFDILYTEGAGESANSVELKIESSPDGVNFYRIPNETVSGGTSTLTAREFTFVGTDAAAATISIGLDIFYKFIKISAKETGEASNFGTIYVEATLSGR